MYLPRLRRLLLLILASLSLALAGCESGSAMPARMRERFAAPQPKIQSFEGDQSTVFAAAKSALRLLDFQVTRAGMAQGILNAHSRLQPGDSFGKARQYTMEVRLQSYELGITEVAVVVRQQEESASFAGATDLVVKEHGLYDSFFAALSQSLPAAAPDAGAPKQ